MDPDFNRLLDEDMLIPLTAIICGSVIAVVAIIFTAVRAMVVSRNKEQTKRELAAYVAEGSLDPDKAVSMINAGRPHWEAGHGGDKGKCA
ncbi:MAG: hypothetical protein L0Y44_10245 [Phycisphaerales bacterium]|nr:hypothetical protein [Phycisphaerales bacterium]MCI0676222.1 hypothetical protein [Phycisphaerales bacterium]